MRHSLNIIMTDNLDMRLWTSVRREFDCILIRDESLETSIDNYHEILFDAFVELYQTAGESL